MKHLRKYIKHRSITNLIIVKLYQTSSSIIVNRCQISPLMIIKYRPIISLIIIKRHQTPSSIIVKRYQTFSRITIKHRSITNLVIIRHLFITLHVYV